MPKKMLIDATHAEETRVVVVDGNKVEEFDFETVNKRQLAGNIYLAKVTRVEPSLQAAFVDYGGNRHGFLAFAEIHPDYYQIPVADREALLAEERELARAERNTSDDDGGRRRGRSSRAEAVETGNATTAEETDANGTGPAIAGMEFIDLDTDTPDNEDMDGAAPGGELTEIDKDESIDEMGAEGGDDLDEEMRPRKNRSRRYKIQEVIKVRQIMLVQVVKEERGTKGAALTTYLSLAGRYCVLMPNTARGGGISRKITNASDRKRLKEIAGEIEVPEGAGLIVRTAGAERTKPEIRRDYEYLLRQWEEIRELTLQSIAPAPIYEEGNLIKRSIRDLYHRDIDEVLVEGELGYRTAKDFMKMLMPSHASRVKLYSEPLPLFARYQVESYLASMFNPTVQLKSGGYIVIGVTEALVAIDVNSGKATKEGSIEQTALKTNLEAAEEVARQLRLRDLAGLIVIDFIDMDDRKNNAAVEKKMKEKLKSDRARIQVGRISGFGLMEMSRQRLRPGMIEASTQPCPHCHGTGLIRSDDSLALSILRQIEEEGTRNRSREVLLRAPVGIINFLMNEKREHIAGIEGRYGLAVRLEADPSLVSPDFSLEKFKTATRRIAEIRPVVSVETSLIANEEEEEDDLLLEDEDEADAEAETETTAGEAGEEDDKPKKKRSRRRRRSRSRGSKGAGQGEGRDDEGSGDDDGGEEAAMEADDLTPEEPVAAAEAGGEPVVEAPHSAPVEAPAEAAAEETAPTKPSRSRSSTSSRSKPKTAKKPKEDAPEAESAAVGDEAGGKAAAKKPAAKRGTSSRSRSKKAAEPAEAGAAAPGPDAAATVPAQDAPAPVAAVAEKEPVVATMPAAGPVAHEDVAAAAPSVTAPVAGPIVDESTATPPAQKKRGWWSRG
ncbi:MAG: ribonuclease E/G [Rhodobacteraceae bacterium]|nr:ribonuclease E/G [Paracoccaceae bacterium]